MLLGMNLLLTLFISFFCCLPGLRAEETQAPIVLVSIAPHKFFVEHIAGDTVNVMVMVPAGASLHTYEPTPRQMLAATRAVIWFRMGESFETKAIDALVSHHPEMILVDLRQGLDLVPGTCNHDHGNCSHAHTKDLHFWLSARMAKTQTNVIAEALIRSYPQHEALYRENLTKFHRELDQLDAKLTEELKPVAGRMIMVSHPAYAYFCRDYNLKQFSIEFEGKDPTPRQLTRVLEEAREAHTKVIFVQPQYGNKGANLIAKTIGAKVVSLDPYSEDYLNTMESIGSHFLQSMTEQ
jgi:zinc transport system substrate-binding protein